MQSELAVEKTGCLISERLRRAFATHELDTLKCVIIGGSGWQFLEKLVHAPAEIVLNDMPLFAGRTHMQKKTLLCGYLGDSLVCVLVRRLHLYEGFTAADIAMFVNVLAKLGIRTAILTNASGSLVTGLRPGDLVLINDHINCTGDAPLWRSPEPFVDTQDLYTERLRGIAGETALRCSIKLAQGVYCGVRGPFYETPSEVRMFASFGAHMVGMSTVHEALAAHMMGMEVIALSCIANMAAGLCAEPLSHRDVVETVDAQKEKLIVFIEELTKSIHRQAPSGQKENS